MIKRLLALILICICVFLCSCGKSSAEKFVFRNVDLGMTLEEVDKAEEQAGETYYETYIVMGVEEYGRLGNAVYAFNTDMSSLGDITFMLHDGDYEEFTEMLSILSNKYGNPDSNEDKRTEENFPRHQVRWYTEKEVITLLYMNDETSVLIDSKDAE